MIYVCLGLQLSKLPSFYKFNSPVYLTGASFDIKSCCGSSTVTDPVANVQSFRVTSVSVVSYQMRPEASFTSFKKLHLFQEDILS